MPAARANRWALREPRHRWRSREFESIGGREDLACPPDGGRARALGHAHPDWPRSNEYLQSDSLVDLARLVRPSDVGVPRFAPSLSPLGPPPRRSPGRAKRRTRSPAASPIRTAAPTARRALCRVACHGRVLRGRKARRAFSRASVAFVERRPEKCCALANERKAWSRRQGPEPDSRALIL